MSEKRRSRWYWWVSFIFIVLLIVLYGLFGDKKDETSQKRIVKVRLMNMIPTVRATGIVRAKIGAKVRVGARISGRVERLNANIGDKVQKGQIIAQLDMLELNAKIAHAQAQLRQAQAHYALIRRGARKEDIMTVKASLMRTQAIFEEAQLEFMRQQQLLKKNLISKNKVDRAKRNFRIAQANLIQVKAQLSWKRHRYLPEERRLAFAKVSIAKATLQLAKIKASYAVIRAPISGIISSVSTQKGETISAGFKAPTFVTIIDLNRLQVETFVDEVDIGKIKIGQKALFQVDSYPAHDFEGRVSAIYPNAIMQSNVVNYIVVVSLSNQSKMLRPGMTTNVTLSFGSGRKVITIPRTAIKRKGRRRFVMLQAKDGTISKREIRVGRRKGRYIEVKSGLKSQDRVVF